MVLEPSNGEAQRLLDLLAAELHRGAQTLAEARAAGQAHAPAEAPAPADLKTCRDFGGIDIPMNSWPPAVQAFARENGIADCAGAVATLGAVSFPPHTLPGERKEEISGLTDAIN